MIGRNPIDLELALARMEAAGDLPKPNRVTVEDEVTHILSERFNDNAPIGEERYRLAAQRVLGVALAAERKRVREALLAGIDDLDESVEIEGDKFNMLKLSDVRDLIDGILPEEG